MCRTSKQIFKTDPNTSPDTWNCIYLIFCIKCNRQYVGQTKNEFRKIIYQHSHNITHKIEKRRYVVQHFFFHGLLSLRATVLQTSPFWDLKDKLRIERYWIKKLDTLYTKGLNEIWGEEGLSFTAFPVHTYALIVGYKDTYNHTNLDRNAVKRINIISILVVKFFCLR